MIITIKLILLLSLSSLSISYCPTGQYRDGTCKDCNLSCGECSNGNTCTKCYGKHIFKIDLSIFSKLFKSFKISYKPFYDDYIHKTV